MKKILLSFIVLINLGTLNVQKGHVQELDSAPIISENGGHPIFPPLSTENGGHPIFPPLNIEY
ncbi:hypothetical protein AMS60_02445 [Bacillus sp. FJAT-21945]|nr:hypothetical protein AMS60_02445 [Bacillus sp. FJAT-21945]